MLVPAFGNLSHNRGAMSIIVFQRITIFGTELYTGAKVSVTALAADYDVGTDMDVSSGPPLSHTRLK